MFQVEFLTVEEYDIKGHGKRASFVLKCLRSVMNEPVVLQLSLSGITKKLAKKSNLKELYSIWDLKGIVMLIKCTFGCFSNYLAFKMKINYQWPIGDVSGREYPQALVLDHLTEMREKLRCSS